MSMQHSHTFSVAWQWFCCYIHMPTAAPPQRRGQLASIHKHNISIHPCEAYTMRAMSGNLAHTFTRTHDEKMLAVGCGAGTRRELPSIPIAVSQPSPCACVYARAPERVLCRFHRSHADEHMDANNTVFFVVRWRHEWDQHDERRQKIGTITKKETSTHIRFFRITHGRGRATSRYISSTPRAHVVLPFVGCLSLRLHMLAPSVSTRWRRALYSVWWRRPRSLLFCDAFSSIEFFSFGLNTHRSRFGIFIRPFFILILLLFFFWMCVFGGAARTMRLRRVRTAEPSWSYFEWMPWFVAPNWMWRIVNLEGIVQSTADVILFVSVAWPGYRCFASPGFGKTKTNTKKMLGSAKKYMAQSFNYPFLGSFFGRIGNGNVSSW